MDIIIYLLVFLPIFTGALILSPVFPTEERGIRHIVKFITYICFALSITLCMFYDFWQSENTIEVSFSWINSLGIDVSFVVDTLSAILTAISSFIFIIVCNISRGVKFPQRLYYALILALQTSVTGMILSKDMMLFTTFTALTFIPTFILINKWGSTTREKTARKYFLYKLSGLALLFIGFLLLYVINFKYNGILSSDINDIDISALPENINKAALLCLLTGFFFNFPIVPFHRWATDSLTNSPTGLSIIISSLLFAGYVVGFIRYVYCPFEYEITEYSVIICLFAAIAIIYAALCVVKENNLKQIISYSELIASGIFLLGLSSQNITGITGAILFVIFYMFAITGLYITEQHIFKSCGTNNILKINGLSKKMPRLMMTSLFFLPIIPVSCGFIACLFCLSGAFHIEGVGFLNAKLAIILTIIALSIYTSKYIYVFTKIFSGKIISTRKLSDIKTKQFVILMLIAAAIIFISVFMFAFTDIIELYLNNILNQAELFNGIN